MWSPIAGLLQSRHLQRKRWPQVLAGRLCRSAPSAPPCQGLCAPRQCAQCWSHMALARENTVFHTRFHHFPGPCSGLRSVYKLSLSFRIKTDSTAFLVDTRSKSMTTRAQGIALVVLSLKLVCLLPSCPLCHQFSCGNCFSFLKLHSFLVLMNKGGQLQASPPCWEGHFWEPAVSFLGLTITRVNSVVKFLFTHFYHLSGSGETKKQRPLRFLPTSILKCFVLPHLD